MHNPRPLILVTLALLSLGACSRRQTWQFSLAPHNGKARIDMDGVTLIFEGVPLVHPPGGNLGGASGSLVVAGAGTHRITVTVAGRSFENSYADGVNTMTFESYTLMLRERGAKLQVGTQEFDLAQGKTTIIIAKDGTARIKAE
ncbi:MAG: hypothetical protein O6952_06940 [Planctomycetota bacterium]|nr:hypothetical protein [Planctomycetota bacterium]